MKQVRIRIDPVGQTEIEAEGYSGCGCTGKTEAIAERLGRITDRAQKPEYFEAESENEYLAE